MRRSIVILCGIVALAAGGAAEARPERMCPMVYRPVCAVARDGHHKSFSNRCMAEAAHAWIRHEGECRRRH